jgi:hypothetical protein
VWEREREGWEIAAAEGDHISSNFVERLVLRAANSTATSPGRSTGSAQHIRQLAPYIVGVAAFTLGRRWWVPFPFSFSLSLSLSNALSLRLSVPFISWYLPVRFSSFLPSHSRLSTREREGERDERRKRKTERRAGREREKTREDKKTKDTLHPVLFLCFKRSPLWASACLPRLRSVSAQGSFQKPRDHDSDIEKILNAAKVERERERESEGEIREGQKESEEWEEKTSRESWEWKREQEREAARKGDERMREQENHRMLN